jgi:hypothetical protein
MADWITKKQKFITKKEVEEPKEYITKKEVEEPTKWITKKKPAYITKKKYAGGGIAAGMRRFNRGGKV